MRHRRHARIGSAVKLNGKHGQRHLCAGMIFVLALFPPSAWSLGTKPAIPGSAAPARLAEAATPPETCNGPGNSRHILPEGSATDPGDLVVDGISCVADGSGNAGGVSGSYVYRNVHIIHGGTLTFEDAQIDFHAHSILVEMNSTLQAGATSPIKGPLTIWLWGKQDESPDLAITCLSDTKNQCGVPDADWNSNRSMAGRMKPNEPCTPATQLKLPDNDCFYQYDVVQSGDPAGAYFGHKVFAVSAGGNLLLRGAKGIRTGPIEADPADSGTSWARLTSTIAPGATSFTIDRAVPTWAAGDHIVVTTTDYLPGHSEELVIKQTTTDANGVTHIHIDTSQPAPMNAVQYPHWGEAYDYSSITAAHPGVGPATDPNRSTLPPDHIETRAVVALLSRSIRVASEGGEPTFSRSHNHFQPTEGNYYGGNTIVRQGFATFEVQGVEFYQLGQGGSVGRYPVHFHMDREVPQPNALTHFAGTYVADSSIVDSMTRFITVHATQGVTLARNVGYKSIGHGYYLEDATETNNRLYSNVGISVRAALDDPDTNPRKIPGILDLPVDQMNQMFKFDPPLTAGQTVPDRPPYTSDVTTPSVFWIMNTWNDLEYNVAVGAGTCGACYWMPPGAVSGPSRYETWKGYAGMEVIEKQEVGIKNTAGITPILNFKGNSCSAAMNAITTVGATNQCEGVVYGPFNASQNTLVSVPNDHSMPADDYPVEDTGNRAKATVCDAAHQSNCSRVPPCGGEVGTLANCAASVIDHFTTSFNWAPTNFSAVWLRGWWYLFQNSAITDVQNGGITFITGGGYSRADAAQGYWSVLKNSILVGNTQPINSDGFPDNSAASNAGPFNPSPRGGLPCPFNPSHCVSVADGITFVGSNLAVNQRLFNIYDGPSTEYSNIYSDIHVTDLGTLNDCRGKNGGVTEPGGCTQSGYMNGYVQGVLQSPRGQTPATHCILPNAALAWKQPNGFYYPPAFNSDHLVFHNVDIRHFVILPLYEPNSYKENRTAIENTYCTWEPGMFAANFTDIDRQTELTDNDGSLTGLTANNRQESPSERPTISVNKDDFFAAPLATDECASGQPASEPKSNDNGATLDTSPYEYFTTAIVAECARDRADNKAPCTDVWTRACSTPACYGVPLYRESLTQDEYNKYQTSKTLPSIRMSGQGSAQRSTLTVNHGKYYVDTTVSKAFQEGSHTPNINVFLAGRNYDIFFVYANNHTKQTYSLFIGKGLAEDAAKSVITPGRMGIPGNSFPFATVPGGAWATYGGYDATTGVLTVNVDLSSAADLNPANRSGFCQPATYCAWNSSNKTCGCNTSAGQCRDGSSCMPGGSCADGSTCRRICTDDKVCSFGTKDIDCPEEGCYGFRITLPSSFTIADQPLPPPAPGLFTNDPYFEPGTVTYEAASPDVAGNCHYQNVPTEGAQPRLLEPRPFLLDEPNR